MLRCIDRVSIGVAVFVSLGTTHAVGQTIADYSRSQRAVIEAAIARQGQATPPVPVPLPSAPPAPVPLPVLAQAERPGSAETHAAPPAAAPTVEVTGAFASASTSLAEVTVDGVPFMLGRGEGVPGTPWVLDAVEAHRVVMSRPGPRSGRPTSRTFLIAGEGR